MIKELDSIVLTHDIDAHGLKRGDVGAVVHAYPESEAYEVEFVTAEGETVALLKLGKADVRPLRGREILHAREMSQGAT